jgi:hypothetical protein
MRIFLFLTLLMLGTSAFSQKTEINNFIVKESLLKNSKLAIIAADSLDQPNESINGKYTFTISGFSQTLSFHDGVAVVPLQLEKSSFVYIRHQNDRGTHSKLLYVYKKEGSLSPYPLSTKWLIFFPLIIIFLIFAFRRFIIIGVVLLLVFIYFNHSNGLSLGTFFDTIFDSLKQLF